MTLERKSKSPAELRDERVSALYDQLIDIESRLIPTSLHVFGQPPPQGNRVDMLRMIASFDRPEAGARALTDLIAESFGSSYSKIIEQRTDGARIAR